MQLLQILTSLASIAAVFARTSLQDNCGPDSKVISTKQVAVGDRSVNVTTTSCPGLASSKQSANSTASQKRQESCNTGCLIQCGDLSGEQPFVFDCQDLTDALESLYPQDFLAPANTITTFSIYTCAYSYFNLDTETYSVCYLDVGVNGINTADKCFGDWPAPDATMGGLCTSSMYAGNEWAVEVHYS